MGKIRERFAEEVFRQIEIVTRHDISDDITDEERIDYSLQVKAPSKTIAKNKVRGLMSILHPSDVLSTEINNIEEVGTNIQAGGKSLQNIYSVNVTIK